uniref:Ataxin 3 n=1 Tax=Molossus molossus TaxID=27622 RepID=A0A7J8JRM4_MOLMO|nr:ataxin 3 [Molossus molossus]
MKKQISVGLFSSVCKVVLEIHLKIFHRHQVHNLLQKSYGKEEKPTLKSSSSSSRTHQDSFRTHVKRRLQVQKHLAVI